MVLELFRPIAMLLEFKGRTSNNKRLGPEISKKKLNEFRVTNPKVGIMSEQH